MECIRAITRMCFYFVLSNGGQQISAHSQMLTRCIIKLENDDQLLH